MKKHFFLLSLVFIAVTAYGQISIPNGNFETWNSDTCINPQGYPYTTNLEDFFSYNLISNVVKTTDAKHGSYAVQLTTVLSGTDTTAGYFLNTNPNSGNGPSSWTGGMACSQKPTGIRGYYKYNNAVDSATIILAFSKSGVNIGSYMFLIGGIKNTYTLFNFTFNPPLSTTPDSVVFAAISCKISGANQGPTGIPGEVLKIDSVSFTGLSSQPPQMNGDFETWQSQVLNAPAGWYVQGNGGLGEFNRTADAAKGSYAIELKTFLGNQNNHPAAQPTQLSTGYFPHNCDSNCVEQGGYPFTNEKDTLAFYYKYAPANISDSASVNLILKKNGNYVWGVNKLLSASVNYKYVEMPFNSMQAPDTAIVLFLSSNWKDTLFTFVGSDLKIDEIHFKSQPLSTGIFNFKNDYTINIFPNPAKDNIIIENLNNTTQNCVVSIKNIQGKEIISEEINLSKSHSIDVSRLSNGIYMVTIKSKDSIKNQKLIIQR